MSNFLKKGQRTKIKQQTKDTKKAMKRFEQTLVVMNDLFYTLLKDDTVTPENIDSKITELTQYKLTDSQLEMLKTDLFKKKQEISQEENPQLLPEDEKIAFTE